MITPVSIAKASEAIGRRCFAAGHRAQHRAPRYPECNHSAGCIDSMAGALLITAWFAISVRSMARGCVESLTQGFLAFGLLFPRTAKSAEAVEVSVIVVETQDEAGITMARWIFRLRLAGRCRGTVIHSVFSQTPATETTGSSCASWASRRTVPPSARASR